MILAMAKALENQAEVEKAMAMYESLISEFPGSPAAADAAQILPGLRLRLAEALQSSQPDGRSRSCGRSSPRTCPRRMPRRRAACSRARCSPAPTSRAAAGHFRDALADYQEAEQLDPSLKRAIDLKEPEVLARAAIEAKDKMEFAEAVALWKELGEKYPAPT